VKKVDWERIAEAYIAGRYRKNPVYQVMGIGLLTFAI